jgi:hypothetical protein
VEVVEGSKVETTKEVVEEKEETIPSYLVEAGKAAGLDADTINSMAQNDMDSLKDLGVTYLKTRLQPRTTPKEEAIEVEEPKVPEPLEHVNISVPANADAATKQLIEALVVTQNKMIDAHNADRTKLFEIERGTALRDTQTQAELDARIDGFFDKRAADLPDLGVNASLTPDQLESRLSVFRIALTLKGGSIEEKLEKATKAWEGMTGKAEQNLRRKLDKNKERFSPRPSGQKAGSPKPSGDDAALAEMYRVAKEIGIQFGE